MRVCRHCGSHQLSSTECLQCGKLLVPASGSVLLTYAIIGLMVISHFNYTAAIDEKFEETTDRLEDAEIELQELRAQVEELQLPAEDSDEASATDSD